MKAKVVFATIFILTVLTTLTWLTNIVEAQVVTDGLVSYWTLNKADIDGETAKDVWGENDGEIVGNPQIVKGQVNEALEFDGDNFIKINDKNLPDGQKARTVSVWAKFKGDGSNEPAFCYGTDSSGQRFDVHQRGDGIGIAFWGHFWGSPELQEGWTHLVIVIPEGIASTDGAKVYINGERITEETLAGGPVAFGTVLSGNAWIGKNFTGPFQGTVDEVIIYKKALSEEEVKQNYQAKGLAVNSYGSIANLWGRLKTK